MFKVNSSNTGKLIASAKFGYIEDSFTTLNDLISSNSPVILNHNYKFYKHWDDDFKEGIIIGDNVIIEGILLLMDLVYLKYLESLVRM